MNSVVRALEERFHRIHPGVYFDNRLMGTDTAMPGLYNGEADLALFGRESNTTENDGFLHTLLYPPLRLRLMNGSLDSEGKSYAPVLFVAEANPLRGLTLAQVDAALGCGQPGQGAPVRTWGDLGLTGDWKDKPVHVYTFDITSGTGIFLLHRLQGDSRKMNWAIVREFSNTHHSDGSAYPAGQQTIDALRNDPYGIAVSGLQYARRGVRALALAATATSPYIMATKTTVIDGSYPLARMTYVFVNRPPNQPVASLVKEFLQFVYGNEGRQVVAAQPGFLPLSSPDADRQDTLLR